VRIGVFRECGAVVRIATRPARDATAAERKRRIGRQVSRIERMLYSDELERVDGGYRHRDHADDFRRYYEGGGTIQIVGHSAWSSQLTWDGERVAR
jgi:hypothetical protein